MDNSNSKNYIIEFLRIIFTLGVVVAHTYVYFYMNNNPSYKILFQISCVDFFFLTSGYFIGKHFGGDFEERSKSYVKYILSRISRLFPLLVICAAVEIISEYTISHNIEFTRRWMTFIFMGYIQNFEGWGPVWYISVLFWVTLLFSYLLCYHKRITVYLLCPVAIFLSLSVMSQWWCANLSSVPLIGGWFSSGFLRGFYGISCGIESYFLGLYIKKYESKLNQKAIDITCFGVELFFLLVLFYQLIKQGLNSIDFLFNIVFSMYLVVMQLNRQKILKIVNYRIFGNIAKIMPVIYVIHLPVIKQMLRFKFMHKLNDIYVYCIICSLSFLFAALIYFIEKPVRKIIKKFYFKAD